MLIFLAILTGLVFGFTVVSSAVAVLGMLLPKLFGFESRVEALKFMGLMFLALFGVAMLEGIVGVKANEKAGLFTLFVLIGLVLAVVHAVRRYKEGRGENQEPSRLKVAWQSFKEEIAKEMAKTETTKEQKPKEASYVFRSELLMEYQDAEGNVSSRKISSIRFDGTYIKAHCHKRGEFRTFRIDRVISLADTVTGELIADPELYVFKNY